MERQGIIYSIFVRTFSKEGTFKAVIPQLDRIKALGVDIIWLMPIHPIGKENRKGIDGSPYANKDFRTINPEYGTMDDFIELCQAIHERGMKVMIDVVYNHTSPDATLVSEHPEWYYYTPEGKRGNRVGDWYDIVDLDYGHKGLWDYQIASLCHWAQYVDGFRCDVAPLVPIAFWQEARQAVAAIKPDFIWLSESVEASFIKHLRQCGAVAHSDCEMYQAFDLLYDYDVHPHMLNYLRGQGDLATYIDRVNLQEIIYPKDYIKLRHLENHDNQRIADLIKDEQVRKHWTAFLYLQKGWVLLYNGQEHQDPVQQSLFDKEEVNWDSNRDISPYLRQLADIKKTYIPTDPSARYDVKLDPESGICVIEHESKDALFVAVCGLGHQQSGTLAIDLPDGSYRDLLNEDQVIVSNGQITIQGQALAIRVDK